MFLFIGCFSKSDRNIRNRDQNRASAPIDSISCRLEPLGLDAILDSLVNCSYSLYDMKRTIMCTEFREGYYFKALEYPCPMGEQFCIRTRKFAPDSNGMLPGFSTIYPGFSIHKENLSYKLGFDCGDFLCPDHWINRVDSCGR